MPRTMYYSEVVDLADITERFRNEWDSATTHEEKQAVVDRMNKAIRKGEDKFYLDKDDRCFQAEHLDAQGKRGHRRKVTPQFEKFLEDLNERYGPVAYSEELTQALIEQVNSERRTKRFRVRFELTSPWTNEWDYYRI